MTLGIVTSRTVRSYSRKPPWVYGANLDSPQSNGLVGWWAGDPSGGTSLFDLAAGRTGTLLRGASSLVTGWKPTQFQSNALSLNGTDDYVNVGDYSNLDFSTAFTLSAWVYMNPTQPSPDCAVVSKNGSNPYPGYMIWIDPNKINLYINTGSRAVGATTVVRGVWNHVAAVWTGTNALVYLNGRLDGSGSWSTAPTSAGQPFLIGQYRFAASRHLAGQIDDVRAYNLAHPANVIEQMWDGNTRWDLHYQPGLRSWLLPSSTTPAVAGTFNAAWLSCNKFLGGGIC